MYRVGPKSHASNIMLLQYFLIERCLCSVVFFFQTFNENQTPTSPWCTINSKLYITFESDTRTFGDANILLRVYEDDTGGGLGLFV